MGVRWFLAAMCAVMAMGCASGTGAEDEEFRARIPSTCRTLEHCLLLRDEAQRRTDDCAPIAADDPRCADVRHDANDIDRRIRTLQAKRATEQEKADRAAEERRE